MEPAALLYLSDADGERRRAPPASAPSFSPSSFMFEPRIRLPSRPHAQFSIEMRGGMRVSQQQQQQQQQQQRQNARAWVDPATIRLVNHFIIEFMASIMLCYSELWLIDKTSLGAATTALDPNSIFRQFIPSLAISAAVLALKDVEYIFPDCNSMTTIVLYFGGAYTDGNGFTDMADIIVRILAHCAGWVIVFYTFVYPNNKKDFYHPHELGPEWTAYVNECFAVAIESLAAAYVTIPLLKRYDHQTREIKSNAVGFMSKAEAAPPSNKDVAHAAISLGLVHYVVQICFRANLSFYAYAYNVYFTGGMNWFLLLAQLGGLVVSCFYAASFFPADHIIRQTLDNTRKQPV